MILITQPRVGHSHNEIIALQMSAESLGHEVLPSPYSWRMEDDLINTLLFFGQMVILHLILIFIIKIIN